MRRSPEGLSTADRVLVVAAIVGYAGVLVAAAILPLPASDAAACS